MNATISHNFYSLIKDYLKDKPVSKAYIFGSFARNQATDKSDVDILLEVDYSQKKVSLLDFIGWAYDMGKLTGKKIDLVSDDAVSKYIRPYIDKDKLVIYERPRG